MKNKSFLFLLVFGLAFGIVFASITHIPTANAVRYQNTPTSTLGSTVEPISTPDFTPPLPEENYRYIESDDPIILREGEWEVVEDENASGGAYLLSSGTSQDDALILAFVGPTIEINYIAFSSAGTLTIEIDNVTVRTVVTADNPADYKRYAVVDYLEDKPHILRIYPSAGQIAIDGIKATGAATPLSNLEVNFILIPELLPLSNDYEKADAVAFVRLPEDIPGMVVTILLRNNFVEGIGCSQQQTSIENVLYPPDYNHDIVAYLPATCDENGVSAVYSEFLDSGEAIVFIYTIDIPSEDLLEGFISGFSVIGAGSFPVAIETIDQPTPTATPISQ